MIQTREDLHYYLLCDKAARGETGKRPSLIGDRLWKFQILYRRCEYHYNNRNKPWHRLMYTLLYARFRILRDRLCSELPLNVFAEGLVIWHGQNIIVNRDARVGRNCSISNSCCIGIGNGGVPVIGDNLEMSIGSRILGGVRITDDVTLGAGALVIKSIETPCTTWGGVPATCISRKPNVNTAERKKRLEPVLRKEGVGSGA